MTIERLTDGAIGVMCDSCRKKFFIDADNPVICAAYCGWRIDGENHNDTHLCPECRDKNKQRPT